MKPWAKALAWLGLILLAGGGLHWAYGLFNPELGLVGAGAGAAALLLAALVSRGQLGQFLGRRSARLGFSSGASVLMVLALALFLGALATRHHVRWDLTQGGAHTLAPQTVKVLHDLPAPVKVYAFYREMQQGRQEAQDLLEQYAFASRQFTYQFIDPDREPALAKRYDVRTYGTVVLTREEKEERVKMAEEQGMTNALIRLGRAGKKTIYFLTGHGERGLTDIGQEGYSELKKAVEQQNYEVKPLILAAAEAVPADAQLVVLAGPKKALTQPEQERLGAYLAGGGGLMVMLDPQQDGGLAPWLAARGVDLGDDLVIDPQSRLFGASPAWPIAADFSDHDITRPLEGMICIFPLARTVEMAAKRPAGANAQSLVRSGPNSWAESDLDSLASGQARFDEGKDRKGPVSLAVLATLAEAEGQKQAQDGDDKKPPQGRLLVLGNSAFAANAHMNQGANRDLMLNAASFLAEEQDLISIRPKETASQPLMISAAQAQLVFWVPVVVLPLGFLVLGVLVVLSRRRRRA
jgi:ABC-type uncharacterized transport system involved in gliding motility auxiliary subunit